MVVKLFVNNSDTKTVSKSLTNIAIYDCTVKYPCDILSPTILIHDTDNNIARANYVFIQDWQRYYYANVTATPTMWELSCNVDALMSWSTSIRNINTYIERQEFVYSAYIPDNNVTVTTQRGITYNKLGTLSDDYTIVLVTTGSKFDGGENG